MATHAEVLAQTLAARGVRYVFGLPGGEIVAFIDACRRNGLQFLLTGHEASAAWMAQVAGQITGVPGVCAATLGPGATNLVTGIANAYLDRAPVEVTRAVLAPGYIGFYLVEIAVPKLVNYGPAELYIDVDGASSNRVRVYIEP